MEFRTIVQVPPTTYKINHKDQWLLIGSCFAQHFAQKAAYYGFDCQYPFGALYNPLSILQNINRLVENTLLTNADLFKDREQYCCFDFHSRYAHTNQAIALANMNQCIQAGHAFWKTCQLVSITFGSAFIYRHKQTGKVVANCHHIAANQFERSLLSVDEIVDTYKVLIQKYPQKKFLFTVSPIRHIKDGLHLNQISKSTLLLAIQRLCEQEPTCIYFPSYEIMLDELRDYRFYADDMLHPSSVAIEYIWQRFSATFFDSETVRLNDQIGKIRQKEAHRPLQPESDLHIQHLASLNAQKEDLQTKYPAIHWNNSIL